MLDGSHAQRIEPCKTGGDALLLEDPHALQQTSQISCCQVCIRAQCGSMVSLVVCFLGMYVQSKQDLHALQEHESIATQGYASLMKAFALYRLPLSYESSATQGYASLEAADTKQTLSSSLHTLA